MLCIWAALYPNAKVTITSDNINTLRRKIFQTIRNWNNNRIQAQRIAKNLVEQDQLFSYAPNKELEKAFSKTKIIDHKGKKLIIIPTKTHSLSMLAKEQIDNLSLSMLNEYYPNVHWNIPQFKRLPYTNYFIVIIVEK